MRQRALEHVRLDESCRRLRVDLLLILDLDEAALVTPARQHADQILLGALDHGLRILRHFELAERVLELLSHLVERAVRVGGDHRADVLEREADRARLERRQARRHPERVAPELSTCTNPSVSSV